MGNRMSASDYIKAVTSTPKKGRVRGAERVEVDGEWFDSKREAKRWGELKIRERLGEITNLERQTSFPLFGRKDAIKTPTGKQMRYLADFTYVDWNLGGAKVVEDSKGWATDVFKIKKAILAAQGVEVKEV